MSIATAPALSIHVKKGPYSLAAFDPSMAPMLLSWLRGDHELFWLAPKTPPPLTVDKVLAWDGPGVSPMMFYHQEIAEPLGYLELNDLPGEKGHLWMGHCLVRPDFRGIGLGRRMVELMLDEAFLHRWVKRVSLVVFPDNTAAIRCYRAAGFTTVGRQNRFFHTTGRQHAMLHMRVDQRDYELLCEAGGAAKAR